MFGVVKVCAVKRDSQQYREEQRYDELNRTAIRIGGTEHVPEFVNRRWRHRTVDSFGEDYADFMLQ